MNLISKPQADQLAALAVAIRPVGAPTWDAAGVRAAIATVRHDRDLADIAVAVIRLAVNPDERTPARLPNAGAHWPTGTGPTYTPPHIPIPPPPTGPAAAARDAAAAEARRALQEALTR